MTDRDKVHVRDDECPMCHHKLDSATAVDDPNLRPKEGDATVCIKCAAFLLFGKGMKLEGMSAEEFAGLPIETRHNMIRVRRAIAEMRKLH